LRLLLALLACTALALPALAEIPDNTLKVGVLTDINGPFADQTGHGSFVAAQIAAEDFAAEAHGLKAEIVAADHQNKPDVAVTIARRWVDTEGVDAIVDLPNSGVALAISSVMREKHRVTLASSSLTSDLTGKACAPTTVQWMSDTYAQGASTVHAMVSQGLKAWYFITVDYALGHTLERDATTALQAAGGTVVGTSLHPLGASDFSSPLLSAQSSGAQVVALANTGTDAINTIKQAAEFGLTQKTHLAALFMMLSDVHALGLQAAQGLQLTTGFYWDLDDSTRAWSKRFAARMAGRMPTEAQAASYSATLAYLRAARDAGTIVGEDVVAQMRRAPIQDALFGTTTIRTDGRAVHDMYLFQVKSPAQSKGPWDYYNRQETIPGSNAFRPLDAGGCTLK
jgi:branched-chain amino acid transport system substrate-binding protein